MKPLHNRKDQQLYDLIVAVRGHSCLEKPKVRCKEKLEQKAEDISPELRGRAVDASKLVSDLFSEADQDSDGYISYAELKTLFSRVGDGVVQKAMSVITRNESKGDWKYISHERFAEIFLLVACSIPDDAYFSKDSTWDELRHRNWGSGRESQLPNWPRCNKRRATLLPLSVAAFGSVEAGAASWNHLDRVMGCGSAGTIAREPHTA